MIGWQCILRVLKLLYRLNIFHRTIKVNLLDTYFRVVELDPYSLQLLDPDAVVKIAL